MRVWTTIFSLVILGVMAVNAPAQPTAKKHALRDRFQKMDTNHNGILSPAEFVAAHSKMGADKAAKIYSGLVSLGGATTKGPETGMTFEQFKRAHKLWKESHPNYKQRTK